ncbi:MAG: hypothetical protein KF893_09965 [Caldilineaceae bacterium]|nr:hypothetical protein [Caldilineaceae bacterium]
MNGNMDEQYAQMRIFRDGLIGFNERLKASMHDLQARHDHISPHWQDEMRKEYDSQWEPLQDVMKRYIGHESRSYVEFLSIKLHALERYLRG